MPIEDIESQADDELQQDDHDEEGGAAEGGTGGPPPAPTPEQAAAERESRRERQARRREGLARERDQARQETALLRQQLADMARAQRDAADAQRQVADAIKSGQPKPKSWEDAALERAAAAAASIKADDPEGATAFLRQQIALIKEGAGEAAREELAKFKQHQEQTQDRTDPAFLAIAPWLRDPGHRDGVDREIRRLVAREGRDLNNPKVREATVKQAIAKHAAEWDLQTNLPNSYRADDASAVSGAGSRSFAGGSPSLPELNDFQREMADNNPFLKKIKDPAKRYAAAAKRFSAVAAKQKA